MTSKERILAALACEEVDYSPCSVYFHPNLRVADYDLTDWREAVRLQYDLGGDPVAHAYMPITIAPEVRSRTWTEQPDDEAYPVLYKEFATPAGTLRQAVRKTPDWPFGDNIPWSDEAASNHYEPLIKTPDDVDAFAYLLDVPEGDVLDHARTQQHEVRTEADTYHIAVQGLAGQGMATFMFVMGAEQAVMFAVDYPDAFARIAEIVTNNTIVRIQLYAELGCVNLLKRFGGYEQTNFYNPAIFREVIAPQLKREISAARQVGLPMYYRVVTGMTPLLDDIAACGFDCIEGGEPHLSDCSLEQWYDHFAGNMCSWTGISTPVVLGGNDSEAVRREIRHCVEVFDRRGYILGVTNSIRDHFPWENTLAMFDEWKKIR